MEPPQRYCQISRYIYIIFILFYDFIIFAASFFWRWLVVWTVFDVKNESGTACWKKVIEKWWIVNLHDFMVKYRSKLIMMAIFNVLNPWHRFFLDHRMCRHQQYFSLFVKNILFFLKRKLLLLKTDALTIVWKKNVCLLVCIFCFHFVM